MSIQDRLQACFESPLIRPWLKPLAFRRFRDARVGNHFWGVYSSYQDAFKHIPSAAANVGYDHEAPALLYRDLLGKIPLGNYPLMFWLMKIFADGTATKLLDFGGHFGICYYNFKNLIRFPQSLRWTVFDLPSVLTAGRAYALANNETGIDFAESTSGRSDDIFFASGSLQYVEGTVGDELKRLATLPKHVLIGALPVASQAYFTLQNIGVTICPYQIFARKLLVEELESLGYALIDAWSDPAKECHIPLDQTHSLKSYQGFYFRLRN